MRRLSIGFVLALAKVRVAERPSASAEQWKPLSTAAAAATTIPELYYPLEMLERWRENTRRAREHASAYITAELEKKKGRRERRHNRR